MKTLEQKVILVTGASKGIGAAVARQLAAKEQVLLLTMQAIKPVRKNWLTN